MSKKRQDPYSNIRLNYKIWLSTDHGEGILGDGKWQILKAIEEYGSLMAATEALGLTYRRTWGNLKKIEKILGVPLLEKRRGGASGGSTQLTNEGRKLVNAFDKFHTKYDKLLTKAFDEFLSYLQKND